MTQYDLFTGEESEFQRELLSSIPDFQSPQELESFLSRLKTLDVGLFYLGDKLQKRPIGARYRALCPFHQEKTPSFYINPKLNIYRCFGCGTQGGPLRLDHKFGGVVYQRIAEKAKIEDFSSIEEVEIALDSFFLPYKLPEKKSLQDRREMLSVLWGHLERRDYGY